MSTYNSLEQFRKNVQALKQNEMTETLLVVPPELKRVFGNFIEWGPTAEDWQNLLALICHEEAEDWDAIVHHFL